MEAQPKIQIFFLFFKNAKAQVTHSLLDIKYGGPLVQHFAYILICCSICFSSLQSTLRLCQAFFDYAERLFYSTKHFSAILNTFRLNKVI